MRYVSRGILCGVLVVAAGVLAWSGPVTNCPPPGDPYMLYVNASTGVESPDCGTSDLPCRTIQAAVNKVPIVMPRDYTISIAPGQYEGGIMIIGRISQTMAAMTLYGEPGGVMISGPEGAVDGVAIIHSFNVTVENLNIEGFPGAGIRMIDSYSNHILSVALNGNGDGVFLGQSEAMIVAGDMSNNLRHGINCESGWLQMENRPEEPMVIATNAASGLRTDQCHAQLSGSVHLIGNSIGLFAMNAGEITLNAGNDVDIQAPPNGTALVADHHGMIAGTYTCTGTAGACACDSIRYGVCNATAVGGTGGRNRRTVYNQDN